ncbi:MAG: ribonuclease HII [Caldimicrobium sp.]
MLFPKGSALNLIEEFYWKQGFQRIAGIDEAGRGAIAGPLCVGLVIFPKDYKNSQIKDSKLLSPAKREKLYEIICQDALEYAIAMATSDEINEFGIIKALFLAIERCLKQINQFDLLLVDGPLQVPYFKGIQKSLIRGDKLSLSIAGGSILAKVTRDRYMEEIAKKYPQYGFEKHKGYATREHLEALKKYGVCPIHRHNFKCFKEVL